MTVSVGVPVALIRGDVYYWGSLMAACLITSVPLAILYNFFLDRFIAGFTVGAVELAVVSGPTAHPRPRRRSLSVAGASTAVPPR